jgi:hypothetical protein
LGIWSVKPEVSGEFIEAWQVLADWLADKLESQGGAVLLMDTDEPSKYISFAAVDELDKVQELMADDEFQDLWSEVMKYCDDVEPHNMRVVGSVGEQTPS